MRRTRRGEFRQARHRSIRTAGIAGLLHKHDVRHPWLSTATTYCWDALSESVGDLGPDDAISVLAFLEYAPERERAMEAFERVADRILADLVVHDVSATGYVKRPLDFAPHPERLAALLFDATTIGLHLDALVAAQADDGGWPITWEPPSAAAVLEWRGFRPSSASTCSTTTAACVETAGGRGTRKPPVVRQRREPDLVTKHLAVRLDLGADGGYLACLLAELVAGRLPDEEQVAVAHRRGLYSEPA